MRNIINLRKKNAMFWSHVIEPDVVFLLVTVYPKYEKNIDLYNEFENGFNNQAFDKHSPT